MAHGNDRRTPQPSSEPAALLSARAAALPYVDRDAYAVGSEVGQGGIGRVLKAHDRRLDRPVAIKELLARSERQQQRFVREALLTARLQHPAIVPVYEAGRWPDGEPFYAMKLVSGRSLAERIEACTSFAERLALLPHVLTAAQAVAYAHDKRIIHRDLKPANVLVGEFGETVVIDWGLAKDLAAAHADDEPAAELAPRIAKEGLTVEGSVLGTPWYMPPEQAVGDAVDERADVYALGAVLYHVLAAIPPHHETPWERLFPTIIIKPPRPIESVVPQISDDLAAIVAKAMAREPGPAIATRGSWPTTSSASRPARSSPHTPTPRGSCCAATGVAIAPRSRSPPSRWGSWCSWCSRRSSTPIARGRSPSRRRARPSRRRRRPRSRVGPPRRRAPRPPRGPTR